MSPASVHRVGHCGCRTVVAKDPGRAGGLTFLRGKTVTVQIMIEEHMLMEKNELSKGSISLIQCKF